MSVHVPTGDCNLLEALQRCTAWLCRTQPSRHETNVVQLARFGPITVQTNASFGTDDDHQVALAAASTSTTALREMTKDHGEHASRRFHFVRQTLDSYPAATTTESLGRVPCSTVYASRGTRDNKSNEELPSPTKIRTAAFLSSANLYSCLLLHHVFPLRDPERPKSKCERK
jgi:hypothetical protein